MGRIFFKLYLLLVVSLACFIAVVINLNDILHDTIEQHMNNLAQGTLELLENRLLQLPEIQRQPYVDRINKLGGYPLRLEQPENFNLSPDDIKRLKQQGFIALEQEGTSYLYTNIGDQGLSLQIPFGQSNYAHEQRLTRSTFALLQQELEQYPQAEWHTRIESISVPFSFPVQLVPVDEVALDTNKTADLLAGKVVWHQINDDVEFDYFKVANSDYVLRLGPFNQPMALDHVNIWLLVFLALILAISAFFWVWPIWRDLKNLDNSAHNFGQGHFTQRAIIKNRSAVHHLAHTFNSMADRIQALISSHKELTNAVSHELRTPIARLRFGMEMLHNAQDESARQRFMDGMNADIDELDNLVAELLTYARFDRDKPEFEFKRTHIRPWLEDVIKRAQSSATNKHLDYQLEDPMHMARFDPKLMARAMNNLLQNAIRYSNEKILLTVKYKDNTTIIYVDDDGPGIAVEKRNAVFDAFKRLDNSRGRDSGGYGLGLAIVYRVVQWHDASIRIEDSPLGGARFTICLPDRVEQ